VFKYFVTKLHISYINWWSRFIRILFYMSRRSKRIAFVN